MKKERAVESSAHQPVQTAVTRRLEDPARHQNIAQKDLTSVAQNYIMHAENHVAQQNGIV